MIRSIALVATALSFSLTASVAEAAPAGCSAWACGMNGTSLNGTDYQGVWQNGVNMQGVWSNGMNMQGVWENGLRIGGLASGDAEKATHAAQPAVRAVVLPSGETVTLR